MKKIILICSSLLASFIFTTGFANVSTGQVCTPGTSTFCACYTNDLCQGTQCNVKAVIHSMQAFKSWKGNPAGIPSACAFGCAITGDSSPQCATDCVTNTNYFIGHC